MPRSISPASMRVWLALTTLVRVHVVPNGIFHADAPPLARASAANKVIGFLGDMSYGPNISVALLLAERIFPRIRSRLGDATLLIIERDPVPSIRRLDGPAISVTGTVENIWPYVARANIFVFPMFEESGLQNKILEAMLCRGPGCDYSDRCRRHWRNY